MNRITILALVLGMALTATASAQPTRRAIVVGSNNAISSRSPLRYAHRDANGVADVLRQLGGLKEQDVEVLLDPRPEQVLEALDEALKTMHGDDSMVLFYYSGHADDRALFPGGRRLAMADVQARLDDGRARLRIGIIDACRGGGWTGAKGFAKAAPFEVNLPAPATSEGAVLIASSSGDESAHEAEIVQGSFFTHHLLAALRGAADEDKDGLVSVSEAYDYARRRTVRDSAIYSNETQHPSFRVDLHGRRDVALTRLDAGESRLHVHQERGPLSVVHLDSGLQVVEVPEGRRDVMIALPVGRYLIRRRDAGGTRVQEVDLAQGATMRIDESDLSLYGSGLLTAKAKAKVAAARGQVVMLEPLGFEAKFGVGVRHNDGSLGIGGTVRGAAVFMQFAYGLTDRVHMFLPGIVAVQLGDLNGTSWIPWGGVSELGFGRTSADETFFQIGLTAGLDAHVSIDTTQSLTLGIGTAGRGQWGAGNDDVLGSWRVQGRVVYSLSLGSLVTFNPALSYSSDWLTSGKGTSPFSASATPRVSIGAAGLRAGRVLPLVQVHINDTVSIDGYVTLGFGTEDVQETYLAGASFMF